MQFKLGDKVVAKTSIMRCGILGTIKQEDGDKVLVVFDHEIRGQSHAWVTRAQLKLSSPPDHIEVKNRILKNKAMKVIGGLKTR